MLVCKAAIILITTLFCISTFLVVVNMDDAQIESLPYSFHWYTFMAASWSKVEVGGLAHDINECVTGETREWEWENEIWCLQSLIWEQQRAQGLHSVVMSWQTPRATASRCIQERRRELSTDPRCWNSSRALNTLNQTIKGHFCLIFSRKKYPLIVRLRIFIILRLQVWGLLCVSDKKVSVKLFRYLESSVLRLQWNVLWFTAPVLIFDSLLVTLCFLPMYNI